MGPYDYWHFIAQIDDIKDKMKSQETVEKGEGALTGDPDFDEILRECIEVMSTKGVDYAAGSNDRLFNFRQAADELDIPMTKVAYIYLWKHLAALRRYVRTGEMSSEGLKSRIVDIINYCMIIYKIDISGNK